jgi:hypothetical protein
MASKKEAWMILGVNFVWNCHRESEQGRISQGFMPGGAAATHDFFGN